MNGADGTMYLLLLWVDDLVIVYSCKKLLDRLVAHLGNSLPLARWGRA